MIRVLLLSLLLLACGGAPLQTCPDTGFASVSSNDPGFECYKFQYIAKVSREIMLAAGITDDAELASLRAGTHVKVLETPRFSDPLFGSLLGQNRINEGIVLGAGASQCVLLHEELHGLERKRWNLTDWSHSGWTEKGYYAVADFTEWWMCRNEIPRICGQPMTEGQRAGLIAAGWPVEQWDAEGCP